MVGRLLSLLDECMQHDNPTSHDETVESAADSRPAARAKLEEPVTKRARMRQPETWTVPFQQFDEAGIVGKDIDGPRLDLGENAFVEVLDVKTHRAMLANVRTLRKRYTDVSGLALPEEAATIPSVRDLLETARTKRDGLEFESRCAESVVARLPGDADRDVRVSLADVVRASVWASCPTSDGTRG